jgi:hypothetical protein
MSQRLTWPDTKWPSMWRDNRPSPKGPAPRWVRPEAAGALLALRGLLRRLGDQGRSVPCTAQPELWFSDDPADRAEAAEACTFCPARPVCANFATSNREVHGTWAGVAREVGRRPARRDPAASR